MKSILKIFFTIQLMYFLSVKMNAQMFDLGDRVFADWNQNGIFEYSDSGLNAITIEVYDSNTNTLVASTLSTNGGNPYEAGYFNFSLPPGNYKLFIPPFAGSGYGGYVPTFYHSNPVGSTCYPSCNCVDNDLLSTWWTVEIVLDFNTPCVDLGLRESTPLPITLLAFSAITQSSKSKITFTTASEANNAGFDIERSADGESFEKIGWVNGNGNTSDEKHYTFTDTKPLLGMNYYRLRQIDFDGRFEYSHIVSVTFETDEVEIYPNPATDKLFILGGKKDRYVIYNFFGEIIKSFPISESTSLDIEDLNPGIYWIKSMNKGQAMRFVKL